MICVLYAYKVQTCVEYVRVLHHLKSRKPRLFLLPCFRSGPGVGGRKPETIFFVSWAHETLLAHTAAGIFPKMEKPKKDPKQDKGEYKKICLHV